MRYANRFKTAGVSEPLSAWQVAEKRIKRMGTEKSQPQSISNAMNSTSHGF
jgi:hypothetical protein